MQEILDLSNWISNFGGVKWVLEAMKCWNKELVGEIVNIREELSTKFESIFAVFYEKNKEKLDNHAKVFETIFWFESSQGGLFHQKLIFSLYLNNSVNDMTKTIWIMQSNFDFVQLVTGYVNWDNFNIHFWDYKKIQEFNWLDIYREEWQKVVNDLFIAMKEKFSLS